MRNRRIPRRGPGFGCPPDCDLPTSIVAARRRTPSGLTGILGQDPVDGRLIIQPNFQQIKQMSAHLRGPRHGQRTLGVDTDLDLVTACQTGKTHRQYAHLLCAMIQPLLLRPKTDNHLAPVRGDRHTTPTGYLKNASLPIGVIATIAVHR
jgi:hypothetical protein